MTIIEKGFFSVSFCSLSATCLILVSASGFCADWPQFRGPNRDGKSPETGLLKAWPEGGMTPLWVAQGLGEGYSSVAVAGGFAYTTGMVGEEHEGVLHAFDLSGNPRWHRRFGPEWSEGANPGTRATPTVDGGRVYVLSGVGRLVCFDAKTGAVRWSEDVAKGFGGEAAFCGFAESVLIDGDKVICTPGGEDAGVVALDKMTGRTVWTSTGFAEQSAYCSPILIERGGTRLVITITARSVVGLAPETGAVFWRQPQDPDAKDPNHSVSPVYEQGRLYATSGHGKGGQMLELSADGRGIEQKWIDQTLNCLHGGLVVVDGHVYGTNSKGRWVCLDFETGEVMYETRGVGKGSVAYADGMLYCYGEKGTLALVEATPNGYEPVGSFEISPGEGQHWAHPAISGGRLYIRHGDAVMAFDIRFAGTAP